MTTDTPETDAMHANHQGAVIWPDFARKMERERDKARKLFESSKRARQSLSDACDFLQASERELKRERDKARQALRADNRATMDANTRAGMGETPPCQWKQTEDGQWASTCGEMFEFTWLDGPTDNGFKFCPFCGNSISSLPPANENATP